MSAGGDTSTVRAVVESAFRLAHADKLADAERLCRTHLARESEDANLLAALGAILLKKGEYDEARDCLTRATRQEPRFAKPHEDLGMLYLATGRPQEAVCFFEKAVAADPRQASAFYGLATALDRAGRRQEAEAARRRLIALSPGGKALAEAAEQRLAGNTERAEAICGELLIKDPRNIHALRLLARIAADQQRDAAAEGLLRRILSIEPEFFPAYTDLAQFLAERSRFHDAIAMLGKAVAARPDDAGLQRSLADMLAIVGRSAEALAAYEKVLQLHPDHPHALLGRGHMQRIHGQRDAAIAAYRRCTEIRPDIGDAWWQLASMRGFAFTDAEQETLRRQLATSADGTDSAIAMQFAMARVCEANGDYAQAWNHYQLANGAKRRTVAYDPVENETQHDARLRIFTVDLLRRHRPVVRDPDARPIFITGMPRSGSTLIEQILASHSAVDGCGELPYVIMLTTRARAHAEGAAQYPDSAAQLSTDDWRMLGDEYLRYARLHRSQQTPWFTDKMPANFAHLGFIHMMLPEAVFVDARRHPLDACVANYRQLFAQGKNQSYDLCELGEYYMEYLRVMEHWHRVMPGLVLTVNYEEVVSDLEGQVRRLLAHCGLPFEADCLRFHETRRRVNTVSSEQVREPIYTQAVGYWKHYERELGELREILGPALDS